jgi:hypothetical protein
MTGESTPFTTGTVVSTGDGVRGALTRVVIDPLARTFTRLVVEPEHRGRQFPSSSWTRPPAAVQRCGLRGGPGCCGQAIPARPAGHVGIPERPGTRPARHEEEFDE